jgi:hypothetical protein
MHGLLILMIRFSHLIYQRQHNLAPNVFSSDELQAIDHMLSKNFLLRKKYYDCIYFTDFFSQKATIFRYYDDAKGILF